MTEGDVGDEYSSLRVSLSSIWASCPSPGGGEQSIIGASMVFNERLASPICGHILASELFRRRRGFERRRQHWQSQGSGPLLRSLLTDRALAWACGAAQPPLPDLQTRSGACAQTPRQTKVEVPLCVPARLPLHRLYVVVLRTQVAVAETNSS